jgi:hypothetical protein
VLRAFRVTVVGGCNPTQIQLFYNDEHALTLGVRQVNVITTSGITTTNYPFSFMTANPDSANNPGVGSQIQSGDQAGVDTSGRPMFPAIFVTDTNNPNPLAGDWQLGGTGQVPNFVSGTWKGAVRTVNQTTNVTITVPDLDPFPNNWNLGPGSDPVPTPTPINQGYGAEVRWDISQLHDENGIPLQGGHTYRLYFMVHDGDQNNSGGDAGQGCTYITIPPFTPTPTPTASPTPTATPTASPTPILGIVVTGKTLSGHTVVITFQNNTGVAEVLTALQISWPQITNGNLLSVTMGANTIFNTSTGGGSLVTTTFKGNANNRTIAAGASQTLTFTFANNVSTIAALYTGSALFNPFGAVNYLP